MNIFISTFESVAVLLGIGIIGFWIIQRRILPGDILGLLSPLTLDIALPCLIFVKIIRDFTPSETPDWWQLPLWCFLFMACTAVLTLTFMFMAKKETRREFAVSLYYQNAIFFPLAILAGMFGDDSPYLVFLFFFTMFYPAFFFSTYRFFFKEEERKVLDWRKILHPVLIVSLLAVGIRLLGFQSVIPDFVLSILSMVGAMTIPLLMIILGGNMYVDFQHKGRLQVGEIAKFVLIKNIVFPLIFLGLLLLIRPSYPVALLIILQSAIPPVTAVPLVTERCGGNRAIVNQFLVASFLFSLISIACMIWLFSLFFSPS
jgi:malate permease and related proteins